MNNSDRSGFNACGFIGIIISIILSALVGTLFIFGFIPFIELATWIVFGLAILILFFLVLGAFLAGVTKSDALSKCLCQNGCYLLVGVIGTIISTLILLSSVLSLCILTILPFVVVATFFFSLMIIALIALLSCIISRQCSCE